jgi:hypothetical protein
MPSLNDSRKTVEVTIPNIPHGKVVIWDTPDALQMEKIECIDVKSNVARIGEILLILIISWNLEEELTLENIKRLTFDAQDSILLSTTFGQELKKKGEEILEEQREKKTN